MSGFKSLVVRHDPNANIVPFSKWGVCAVFLPRENLHWLEDWIDHHIAAGASKIVLYNNAGSTGRAKPLNTRSEHARVSKRGERYGQLTYYLLDKDIDDIVRQIAVKYRGVVDVITWKPLGGSTRRIVQNQIEAYCDFIQKYKDKLDWAAFIDIDEYLYCKPGLKIDDILYSVEKQYPSCHFIQLHDWKMEKRWKEDGPKDISRFCRAARNKQSDGKTIAKLKEIAYAHVHFGWHSKEANPLRLRFSKHDFGFVHYNNHEQKIASDFVHVEPRNFLKDKGLPYVELLLPEPYKANYNSNDLYPADMKSIQYGE